MRELPVRRKQRGEKDRGVAEWVAVATNPAARACVSLPHFGGLRMPSRRLQGDCSSVSVEAALQFPGEAKVLLLRSPLFECRGHTLEVA